MDVRKTRRLAPALLVAAPAAPAALVAAPGPSPHDAFPLGACVRVTQIEPKRVCVIVEPTR